MMATKPYMTSQFTTTFSALSSTMATVAQKIKTTVRGLGDRVQQLPVPVHMSPAVASLPLDKPIAPLARRRAKPLAVTRTMTETGNRIVQLPKQVSMQSGVASPNMKSVPVGTLLTNKFALNMLNAGATLFTQSLQSTLALDTRLHSLSATLGTGTQGVAALRGELLALAARGPVPLDDLTQAADMAAAKGVSASALPLFLENTARLSHTLGKTFAETSAALLNMRDPAGEAEAALASLRQQGALPDWPPKTAANVVTTFSNSLSSLGLTMGTTLLPPLTTLLTTVTPWIAGLTSLIAEHETLASVLLGGVAGFAALGTGLAVVGYGSGLLAAAWGGLSGLAPLLTAGQWLLNASFMGCPLVWLAAGVAAVVAGMVWLYNTCEPVRTALDKVGETAMSVWNACKSFGQWLGLIDPVKQPDIIAPGTAAPGIRPEAAQSLPKPISPVAAVPPAASRSQSRAQVVIGQEGQPAAMVTAPPIQMQGYAITPPLQTAAVAGQSARFPLPPARVPTIAPPGLPPRIDTPPPFAQSPAFSSATGHGLPGTSGHGIGYGGSGYGGATFNLSFPVTGVTDMDFGNRVINALRLRQGELCSLLANIVGEQRRLSYGD